MPPEAPARPDALFDLRQTGVLLHPTSLPGGHGIGDLGPEARRFAGWLAQAGVRLWQVLPLSPPQGHVPYSSWAALAGHPHLISLEDLCADRLIEPSELHGQRFEEGRADFARAPRWKLERLHRAAERLLSDHPLRPELEAFRARAPWALDVGLFAALHERHRHAPWWTWAPDLRDRRPAALAAARRELASAVDRAIALQFLFERQWAALRACCRDLGISILGDVPIYVAHDSVDVWAHQERFQLAPGGALPSVSGAPPDEFTDTGQRWGHPLYAWDRMAEDDFGWWRARIARALEHADAVRIDHFRALSAYWSIPYDARSPKLGRWVEGPGLRFFEALQRGKGPGALPLCAEDLGAIDDDVVRLREAAGLPGMRILHYAFGEGDDNRHLPHHHPRRCLAYPANHDNDTTLGWWSQLGARARDHARRYLGTAGEEIAWELNEAALGSAANVAVLQLQDVLGLGGDARMNDPGAYDRGRAHLNWSWRLLPGQASAEAAARLAARSRAHGRAAAERSTAPSLRP